MRHTTRILAQLAEMECKSVMEEIYLQHNMFPVYLQQGSEYDECCDVQCKFIFMTTAGMNSLLPPRLFFSVITDYGNEDKKLSYIDAFYSSECDLNIITAVGFGHGNLNREARWSFGASKPGVAYLFVFQDEDLQNRMFPYQRIDELLTFTWFKNNVICRAQPWVCE